MDKIVAHLLRRRSAFPQYRSLPHLVPTFTLGLHELYVDPLAKVVKGNALMGTKVSLNEVGVDNSGTHYPSPPSIDVQIAANRLPVDDCRP